MKMLFEKAVPGLRYSFALCSAMLGHALLGFVSLDSGLGGTFGIGQQEMTQFFKLW